VESNWRFTVWNEGWWGEGFALAARLLGDPDFLICWTPVFVDRYFIFTRDPSADWPWVLILTPRKPIGFRHFPYGNEVEPDFPVVL